MDPRLIAALARMSPAQREAAAAQFGLTREHLEQLGFSGAGDDDGDEEGHDDGDEGGGGEGGADGGPSIMNVWEVAMSRFWSRASLLLFLGAVPLVLLLIKERRALTVGQLFSQALRLPFSD